MSKWEERYNELKNGKLDEKMQEFKEKAKNKEGKEELKEENRGFSKEDYKEYKIYERIKQNMPKIENLLEYRGYLKVQLKQIDNELARREEIVRLENEQKQLESDLEDLKIEKASLEFDLKDKNLSEEEKSEKEAELRKIKDAINQNQDNFSKNLKTLIDKKSKENKKDEENHIGIKYRQMSEEELKDRKTDIGSKISKCNMAARNLVEGKSWDAIDIKLQNWKTYTSSKETAEKIKRAAKVNDRTDVKESQEIKKEENDSKLAKISEFEQKHPKLATMKNWVLNQWSKLKNKITKRMDTKEKSKEEEVEAEAEEKGTQEPTNNKEDEFRAYLRNVAEKGMKQADTERREELKKRAQAKIENDSIEQADTDSQER